MRFISLIFKTVVISIMLIAFTTDSFAQRWKLRRYEVAFNLGALQTFGDFGTFPNGENWLGLKDVNFTANRPAAGVTLRYKLSQLYSVSLNGSYGVGVGEAGTTVIREHKTKLYEVNARFEYFLISEASRFPKSAAIFNRRAMINNYRTISIYSFLGVGGLYMQPEFMIGPSKELLERIPDYDYTTDPSISDYRTILTEPYSSINIVVPLGLGARYLLNDKWIVGGEVGWRWTSTDWIDGFSKLDGSINKHNDVYYFFMFNITHRIKTSRRGIPAFMDRSFQTVRRSKRAI